MEVETMSCKIATKTGFVSVFALLTIFLCVPHLSFTVVQTRLQLVSTRSATSLVPYDFERFPFDYHEPNLPPMQTLEYEYLYDGIKFQHPSLLEVSGYIRLAPQVVSYGVVTHRLGVMVNEDEWACAGIVWYSDGSRYCYIKWQTYETGFRQVDSSVPDWQYIHLKILVLGTQAVLSFYIDDDFHQVVNFSSRPTIFLAQTKSLSRHNIVNAEFYGLTYSIDQETSYWWGEGPASLTEIREDAPYKIAVRQPWWWFVVDGGGGAMKRYSGSSRDARQMTY